MRTTDFMRMSHAQAAMKASDIAYENEQLRQQLEMAEACLAGDNALIVGPKNDIAEKDAELLKLKQELLTSFGESDELSRKLVEKDAEIERLSRQNSSYSNLTKAQECQITALRNRLYELKGADKTLDSERDANAILTEQLAAIQAVNQQLRGLLDEATSYTGSNAWSPSMTEEILNALALPQDTSALSSMIAKAGEVMRERCAVECETHYNFSNALAAAIRALPGVTMEDLK